MICITIMVKIESPWQYLDTWRLSASPGIQDLGWINTRMQSRWPGAYRVEQLGPDRGWATQYHLAFADPQEEVIFRLKWAQ